LIGFEESGLDIFRGILDKHLDIATTPNLSIYDRVFSYRKSLSHKLPIINRMIKSKLDLLEKNGVNPTDLRRKMICAESTKDMIRIFIEAFASKKDFRILVEEAPGKSRYTDKITATFPEASIIYMTRDAREVVASIFEKNKHKKTEYLITVVSWLISARMFLKQSVSKSYMFIRYEDLYDDATDKNLSNIFNELGVQYQSILKDGIGQKISRYKEMFNERDRMNIEYFLRPLLEFFGYELEFEKYHVSIFVKINFWWRYFKTLTFFTLKRLGLESLYYLYRDSVKNPVRENLKKITDLKKPKIS
jgi:hypothetical protein